MRFRFLGTGTSAGIPAIACDCRVCTSDDPRDRRLRTSAALEFRDERGRDRVVLIDASPDLRQQALAHRLTRCDAIFFTHNHVDHTFGLDEVRRFNAVQRAPIDVYAEPHTMDHLRRVFRHIFDREKNVNDTFVATLIPHEIDDQRPVELFGLRVTPIRVHHGKLPILGYRFERAAGPAAPVGPDDPFPLAYCTDTSAIPPQSWSRLTGLRTLVLDALRHRKHPTHFTIDEAIRVAEQVDARRTYFIHVAHEVPHAETQATLPERIHLAHDGLVLGAADA